MSAFAWVTLATNDSYSLGALVLAHSLRKVGTAHQLAVMVTPGVTPAMREQLKAVFNLVHEVNVLDSSDTSNLALLARPELGITFTKIHCWTLTQYTKCVFMDADTMVLQHCDELFDREELSAAPDVGWPDCFNSGVFVYQPSMDTFKKLLDFAISKGSFDGGDQGLLNMFFCNWSTQDSSRRLPFIYNMCSTAVYSYLPAFKQFGSDAKVIHFIGPMKPWLLEMDTQTGQVSPSPGYEHLRSILQQWWSLFLEQVLPKLQPDMGGMAGALANLSIGSPRSEQQIALEQHWRRQAWEHGNADYLGKDAFDKIWAKIQTTLQGVQPSGAGDAPSVEAPPPPEATPPSQVEAPPPPPPVEVPTPVTTSTEQPLPVPDRSMAPMSVAPTSPPPGDKKTPAPISSPAQPPPTASATPMASKPELLDANHPSALPVSQTVPVSVEPSTVTSCELADQPLSSPKLQSDVTSLSSSSVVSPTALLPFSPPLFPPALAKTPTTPPISPTPIPLPFTDTPFSPTVNTPASPPPLSPTAAPLSPTAAPLSPTAAPLSPTDAPLSPTDAPSSPIATPSSPTAAPSSPAAPSCPTAAPSLPTATPSSPTPTPSSPTATPSSPTATPSFPTAQVPTIPAFSAVPSPPTSKAPTSPPLSATPSSPTGKSPTSPPLSATPSSPTGKSPTSPPLSATPSSPTGKSPTSPPLSATPSSPTGKSPTTPALSAAPSSPTGKVPTTPLLSATPSSPTGKSPTSPPLSPTATLSPLTTIPLSCTEVTAFTPLSPTSVLPVPPAQDPTALHETPTPSDTQQVPASSAAAPSPGKPVSQPIPQTPTVTDATPPTSPPVGPVARSPEALGVGNVTPPETPPIGSGGNLQATAENQSAESAPIPPKRRGGPNKGGKSGQKGKK